MTLTLVSAITGAPGTGIAGPSTTAKRPAAAVSTTPNVSPAAKRARTSDASASGSSGSVDDDGSDDECDGVADADLALTGGDADQATREKVARKEARTIRNRESAQRSRNQRKAHLAWLEVRVKELEAENASLRGHPSSPGRSFSSTSPAPAVTANASASTGPVTVHSLASDLGVPPSVVNGAGVALASVAPPPRDLELMEDIKPVIPPLAAAGAATSAVPTAGQAGRKRATTPQEAERIETQLRTENAALRDRVLMLENLVKQVVAVSNLGGIPASSASSASAGMGDRASPTLFPASPINQPLPATSASTPAATGLSRPDTPLQPVTELDLSTFPLPLPLPSTLPTSSFIMPSLASNSQTELSDAHNTLARHSAAGEETRDCAVVRDLFGLDVGAAIGCGPGQAVGTGSGAGAGGFGFADAAFPNVAFNGGASVEPDGVQGQAGGAGRFGAGETAGMDFGNGSGGNVGGEALDLDAFASFDFSAFSNEHDAEAFGAQAFAPLEPGSQQWDFPLSAPIVDNITNGAQQEEQAEDGWDVRMHRLIEDLESRVAGMEQDQQGDGVHGMGVLGLDLGLAGLGDRRYEQWAS